MASVFVCLVGHRASNPLGSTACLHTDTLVPHPFDLLDSRLMEGAQWYHRYQDDVTFKSDSRIWLGKRLKTRKQ